MLSAFHAARLAAPAQEVWRYVAWENLELMLPGGLFEAVHYQDRRPREGALRRVRMAGGLEVVERLEHQDAAERRMRYRMIDLGDAPLSEYEGDVLVTPKGPQACAVRFACRYYPLDQEADDFAPAYLAMQRAFVDYIRSQVEKVR
jgi:hypothetical protein